MRDNSMLEDWTEKYRPRKFEELWSKGAGIQYLMNAIPARMLAKALLLTGSYGFGKTSTARIIAQSISCHNRTKHNPCGECDGCEFCDCPTMGSFGSAMFIQGNRFDAQNLKNLVKECCLYAPPVSSGAYVVVIDEAHRIPETAQNALLDIIEDTPRTHFILCTTHVQEVLEGVQHRCVEIPMAVPTIDQATKAMQRIASSEGISIDVQTIRTICSDLNCNPRKCIQRLMQFAIGGEPLTCTAKPEMPDGGLI